MKVFDLIEKKNIITGLTEKEFSCPKDPPHVVKVDGHRVIRCDSHCPRYKFFYKQLRVRVRLKVG